MPWQKGQSGNPKGGRQPKDKAQLLVEVLAREHTESAIETLVQIMHDTAQRGSARVAAAVAVLERGWGKPKQDVVLSGHVDVSTLADASFDEAFRAELAGYIIGGGPRGGEAEDKRQLQ